MTAQRVAEGTWRLGTKWVGWYVLEDGGAVTVVDCGFPGYAEQLPGALEQIGRRMADVEAIVLTHYHGDHVGAAERLREQTGATVHAPQGDAAGVRGEARVPMPKGIAANLWRPVMLRYLRHAAANGGLRQHPVSELRTFSGGNVLDVPGRLRALDAPGHTPGQCALVCEQRGVLFAGDAMGTDFFVSSRTGPQVPAFNEDHARARESVAGLADVDANVLLVGHGPPWQGSMRDAVAHALEEDQ